MKIIGELSDLIDDELCDAEKYAKLALKFKESMPDVADLFYLISLEESKHMNLLHGYVVKLVNELRDNTEPLAEGMRLAYEHIHEHEIKKEQGVRSLQAMFKE